MTDSSANDPLPPLREVIARHGLDARKSLGQNFLFDLNLTRRIARGAGSLTDVTVYEVGPGPGGLTRGLLMEGAREVIAVELDRRAIIAQQDIADVYPGRLTIIEGNALTIDEKELFKGKGPVRIVANLPYNVGTALLIKWLTSEPWPAWFQSLTLMFQREVAERIIAEPRSKDYGRLSVLAQARAVPKILFDVPRTAFIPPPKITSSIIHLIPKDWPSDGPSMKSLERVTAAAFGQRRKMLRSSLRTLGLDPIPLLEAANVPETARAEEIDIPGFLRISSAFEAASR